MTVQVSRRSLLAAIPVSVVGAGAPAFAAAPRAVDRSAWENAMQRYLAAKGKYDAVTNRILKLYSEQARAKARIPHKVFRAPSGSGRRVQVSTADSDFVRSAKRLVWDVDAGRVQFAANPGFQGHVLLCRELTAAAAQRDGEISAIRERLGIGAAEENRRKLADTMREAEEALLSVEAPDVPALRWKLDYVLAEQVEDETSKLPRELIEQTRIEVAKLMEGEEAVGFFDRLKRWFGN